MSEAATSNKNVVQPALLNNGGESPVHGSSQTPDITLAAEGVEAVSENERLPSIQAAASSPNEQKAQPENGLNETLLQLHLLRILTRGMPENESKPTSSDDKEIRALRRKLFGLTKSETGVNNRFNYEHKCSEDKPGEELTPHARVWSIYLDEAETYDRERVEGWKETADVLLVFAGLFSGVITTFLSQASQSLQQDNTQVSASLLSEIAQLLRAQYSGTPINNIPNSPLTSTSPFTPSTNAFLVNGLWFTSLAITLSTALFAVLSKQWLYYYLSSISGTPREKARARQFRFQGFELWKVGAIIDLLPILLHLAVGVFLTGIIILLFPLDVRVAWMIVAITGVTYVLYFVSVILPIRYPGCPYTTSLTIYIGVLFFFLPKIFHWISAVLKKVLHRETRSKQDPQPDSDMIPGKEASPREIPKASSKWEFFRGKISSLFHFIWRFLQYSYVPVQCTFSALNRLVNIIVHLMSIAFGRFASTIPKFTDWREERIKRAVTNAAALDSNALYWLYKTSSATSVRRIIARCAFMHRNVTRPFKLDILDNSLEVNETNVVDFRHGLCVDLLSRECNYWSLVLPSVPNVEFEGQLDKAEYQRYSRIANNVINFDYDQILKDAIEDDTLKLPVAMWQCFSVRASGDATLATLMLTMKQDDLFKWKFKPTPDSTHCTDPVSFQTVLDYISEQEKWKFDYLLRYFGHDSPDYSSKYKPFEIRYLLLVSVYRNLISDQPLITDKKQRQESLENLFDNFKDWLRSYPHVLSEHYIAFFIDICCTDEFWSEDMGIQVSALFCLNWIWLSMDADVTKRLSFMKCHDLSPIYQRCSRDDLFFSCSIIPIFTLLFMPQNRDSLCTLLLNDPNAVSHLSKCFQNFRLYDFEKNLLQSLMDLFMSVDDTNGPLFTILYNSSVLLQLWRFLSIGGLNEKTFPFSILNQKLHPPQKLQELHDRMNLEVQSEQDTDYRPALRASADAFGQSIGVVYSRLQPGAGGRGNLDSEERAQSEEPNENEHQNNSIVHRMKKLFLFGRR